MILDIADQRKLKAFKNEREKNKVAEAEKIKTLNINDLALAVRSEFLPGEKMKIKILEY